MHFIEEEPLFFSLLPTVNIAKESGKKSHAKQR